MDTSGEAERLIDIIRGFRGRRVAVLGDLVADEFVYGDIARISREAPVLILEHLRTEVVPGGGGNSVANLASLGARPLPVGVVGKDAAGAALLAEFRARRISTSGIRTLRNYETPSKSRLLAGGVHTRRQQIVRLDRGASHGPLSARDRTTIREALARAVTRADGLLIADYDYGSAAPQTVRGIVSRLVRGGLPVTVDSRSRVEAFHGATACTPNHEELEQAAGRRLRGDKAVEAAARELQRRTGHQAVLVTRGSRGMNLVEHGRPVTRIPAYGSDEVADVTGAGDTVIAVLTLALICGADPARAARLANYAAGMVVTKMGTATISADELVGSVQEDLQA